MTLTRKVGTLLALLTAGSLAAVTVFAIFFTNSSSDGVFWVASNIKQNLLQDLFTQTALVRNGDAAARQRVILLVGDLDGLLDAMQSGGQQTRYGTPSSTFVLVDQIIGNLSDSKIDAVGATRRVV